MGDQNLGELTPHPHLGGGGRGGGGGGVSWLLVKISTVERGEWGIGEGEGGGVQKEVY